MLPLRTERLTIRMMRSADLLALLAYRNDPAIARYQDWELPFTDAAARRIIDGQAALEGPTDGEWVQLAVDLAGEVIGDVAVFLQHDATIALIGYTFAATHHGNGYATEAVTAVVDALCAAGVHRFVATLDPENIPSMRVLEAVGFAYETLARQAEMVRGEWVDDLRYSMLAADRVAWRDRNLSRPNEVKLVELDDLNVDDFLPLATHHSQQRFVRPIVIALSQMAFPITLENGRPFIPRACGVVADGEPVGFVQTTDRSATHEEPYLWRLLIDRWHQRRGIGTRVLQLLVDQLTAAGHRSLIVSHGEGPGNPGPVYRAFGFRPTGEVVHDETVERLTW